MRKSHKIQLLVWILLLFPGVNVFAQSTVTGIVKDNNGALPGVTIYVMGNNERALTGTATNENGEYYLTIPSVNQGKGELKIVFSFIGYKPQEVVYKNQKVINITLTEDVQTLETVNVVGQLVRTNDAGLPVKDMGVSNQRIDMKEMEEIQATSVEDALQGRLANVDIIASSGDPGSRMNIRIRGTSSLNASSEPLVVIDGIPFETSFQDDFDFATANEEDYGSLLSISPSDIESIEVLKDAAATAMWGSQGANGVLVITTKKGTKTKTRFSFSQKIDFKKEAKQIEMLNGQQYVTLMQDELWNRMIDGGFTNSAYNELSSHPELNFDPSFQYFNEYRQNTDWVDLVTKTALTSETAFSMYGGGDRATYRFSATYLDEGGTSKGTGLKRLTARLNVDYRFSTKLRVGAQFAFSQGTKKDNYSNVRSEARIKMPNMSPWAFNANGELTDRYFVPVSADGYTPWQGMWGDGRYNPLAMIDDSFNNTLNRDIRAKFDLNYDILSGLKFMANMAADIKTTKNNKFLPQSATGVNQAHSDYNLGTESYSENFNINLIGRLTYTKNFGLHKMLLSAMGQISDASKTSYATEVSGSGSANIADPSAGGKIKKTSSGSSNGRTVRLALNAHYNYDDRYMATLGYNLEGNSRMGKDRRFGGFFNVSGQWRFSNERFLREVEWIDEMVVKASWGESGNAPDGSFPYVGTLSPEGIYMGHSGVGPSTIQLNNLKWETVRQTNYGIDLSFFRLIDLNFNIYNKVTDDMLQKNVSLPGSTGFKQVTYYNDGKIRNHGWEFYFTVRDVLKNSKFSLSFNGNISRNRNEILRLPKNKKYEDYSLENGKYAQRVIEGQPIGAFYGYKYLGVYQNVDETIARDASGNKINNLKGEQVYTTINNVRMMPGDAHYADLNNDGVINRYDITYLGNSMPTVTAGFGINAGYKGLRIRTFFQARLGQSVINQMRIDTENMRGKNNQSTVVLNRWRREGDQTDIPRALYQRGYNYLGSDRFVDDATFLRFKQLTVSYDFPKRMIKKIGFEKCNVYVTAYDLCTWTKYKGQDPEVGLSSGALYQIAKDNSNTPRPIRVALGLSIEL